MAFEKTPFGDGSDAGSGNVKSVVSNHFGVRDTGEVDGRTNTAGADRESVIRFDGDGPLYVEQYIPAGAVVKQVEEVGLTGAISAATVGATSIAAADGTEANYVAIATEGLLTVTGPTAGKVIVRWTKLA